MPDISSSGRPQPARTFTDEIQATLADFVDTLNAEDRPVQYQAIQQDIPTWDISVGDRTARLTLYDIEERRSIYSASTPGLNELRTPRDVIDEWYRHTFH